MAQFLANENVPADAVFAARNAGLDVEWIREQQPGADDDFVLERSVQSGRVLLRFDKDFGELVFSQGRTASCGIILFRPRLRTASYLSQFVVAVLTQAIAWQENFCVATEGRVRVIPLPDREG